MPLEESCMGHAGVGAYTGNAIASIACSERVAVVDANVVRVLARLRCLAGDPKQATRLHAALADALLDPARPGDFNQVLWSFMLPDLAAVLGLSRAFCTC
jgi:adenine-specific DNA glycosylase